MRRMSLTNDNENLSAIWAGGRRCIYAGHYAPAICDQVHLAQQTGATRRHGASSSFSCWTSVRNSPRTTLLSGVHALVFAVCPESPFFPACTPPVGRNCPLPLWSRSPKEDLHPTRGSSFPQVPFAIPLHALFACEVPVFSPPSSCC